MQSKWLHFKLTCGGVYTCCVPLHESMQHGHIICKGPLWSMEASVSKMQRKMLYV